MRNKLPNVGVPHFYTLIPSIIVALTPIICSIINITIVNIPQGRGEMRAIKISLSTTDPKQAYSASPSEFVVKLNGC